MMHRGLHSLFQCVIGLILVPSLALAQGATVSTLGDDVEDVIVPVLTAVITSDDQVAAGRNIIFDASQTITPDPDASLSFVWDFGDQSAAEYTAEAVHTYATPGTYTVSLTVRDGNAEHTSTKDITVYSRLILLFTDSSVDTALIISASEYAASQGQLLRVLTTSESSSDFLTGQSITQLLNDNAKDIRTTDMIVLWADGSASIGALSDFAQSIPDTAPIDFSQKTFVYVSNSSLNVLRRIAQSTFRIVEPERILLVQPAALHTIVDTESPDDLATRLATGGIDFKIVDSVSGRIGPLNFMSYLVDYMRNKGVPDRTIFLILIIPVIATIISFIRQVIGISTAGIYAPAIITISLIALGLWSGILIFATVLAASVLSRQMIRRYNIMYIPRMAIVLTLTTLAIFVLLLIASALEWREMTNVQIFPLLILIAMSEKFLNVEAERGTRSSIILMIETLVVAIICYLIVNEWRAFYTFTLAYPEMVFVLLIINVIIGKWTGLRITEYFRFRQVLSSVEHAEE